MASRLELWCGRACLRGGGGAKVTDTSSWWPPGFNPMWEETLVFTVHMPEIALVRFLVWDQDRKSTRLNSSH